jgi:hypothetical protein
MLRMNNKARLYGSHVYFLTSNYKRSEARSGVSGSGLLEKVLKNSISLLHILLGVWVREVPTTSTLSNISVVFIFVVSLEIGQGIYIGYLKFTTFPLNFVFVKVYLFAVCHCLDFSDYFKIIRCFSNF